jgi:glutathione S-transferase
MYLGESFGVDKGLYPPPGPRRGEAMKWIVWTNVSFGDALGRYARNIGHWGPEDERNEKAGASAKTEVEGLLRIVDEALTGRDYLTGNTFTIADLHLCSWLDYAKMMGIDLAPYKKLTAWQGRCTARPAYKLEN